VKAWKSWISRFDPDHGDGTGRILRNSYGIPMTPGEQIFLYHHLQPLIMTPPRDPSFTYKDAGVDILREEDAISALVSQLKFARKGLGAPFALGGHYAGLVDFGEFALSLCTDGVGTKLLVAEAMNKWDTVGIDCIAMNVNDIICLGATPLAFVDYIAAEALDPRTFAEIGKGLNRGAELANMSLIGGETATLPEVVKGLDLAGTCLGFVRKDRIITGEDITKGDVVIGLASSGIHSNGFTLARKVFQENGYSYTDSYGDIPSIGLELLEPTRIYVREILGVLEEGYTIKGLSNITGGGLRNLGRLNRDVGIVIEDNFEPQPIFHAMKDIGNVAHKEMYTTFNMGLGFALVAGKKEADDIIGALDSEAKVVGRVTGGAGVVYKEEQYI